MSDQQLSLAKALRAIDNATFKQDAEIASTNHTISETLRFAGVKRGIDAEQYGEGAKPWALFNLAHELNDPNSEISNLENRDAIIILLAEEAKARGFNAGWANGLIEDATMRQVAAASLNGDEESQQNEQNAENERITADATVEPNTETPSDADTAESPTTTAADESAPGSPATIENPGHHQEDTKTSIAENIREPETENIATPRSQADLRTDWINQRQTLTQNYTNWYEGRIERIRSDVATNGQATLSFTQAALGTEVDDSMESYARLRGVYESVYGARTLSERVASGINATINTPAQQANAQQQSWEFGEGGFSLSENFGQYRDIIPGWQPNTNSSSERVSAVFETNLQWDTQNSKFLLDLKSFRNTEMGNGDGVIKPGEIIELRLVNGDDARSYRFTVPNQTEPLTNAEALSMVNAANNGMIINDLAKSVNQASLERQSEILTELGTLITQYHGEDVLAQIDATVASDIRNAGRQNSSADANLDSNLGSPG